MKILCIILCMLGLGWTLNSHADERFMDLQKNKTIKIGYSNNMAPFSYTDKKNKPVGYAMDICHHIVDDIAKQIPGIKLEFVSLDSQINVAEQLNSGRLDLLCAPVANTIERQKQMGFSPTVFVANMRFLSLKDANVSSISRLTGQSVAILRASTSYHWLEKLDQAYGLQLHIVPVDTPAQGLALIRSGQVKALFSEMSLLLTAAANSTDPSVWHLSSSPIALEPFGIAFAKNQVKFKQLVDRSVSHLMSEGGLDLIYKRWFLSATPPNYINLNLPMSYELARVIQSPTSSGQSSYYLIQQLGPKPLLYAQ